MSTFYTVRLQNGNYEMLSVLFIFVFTIFNQSIVWFPSCILSALKEKIFLQQHTQRNTNTQKPLANGKFKRVLKRY